jgi:hypothetical protein
MLFGSPAPVSSGTNKFVLQFHENHGIQYSPNDSLLMISAGNFNYADVYNPIVPNFLNIINLTSLKHSKISFGDIIGGSWLYDNNFLFIYSHGNLIQGEISIFNTANQEINPIPVSSVQSLKLQASNMLLTYRFAKDTIYTDVQHSESVRKIPIKSTIGRNVVPIAWSPNNKYFLIQEPSSDISKLKLINVQNGQETLIPLLNSTLCAWSKTGKDLFLLKPVLGHTTPVHDLYRYSIDANELQEVRLMWKEVDRIKYNVNTNSFLVIRNGRLEVWDQQQGEKTTLIDKDVLEAAWSNSGRSIAYITKGNKSVVEYSLETGKIKSIAKWSIKKKELIIE